MIVAIMANYGRLIASVHIFRWNVIQNVKIIANGRILRACRK